ncbi:Hypothetical protein PBC10988_3640 [Planctomycetales bacterium 10988]|nr:Hypothetical protein PBC10988_3640 [Planctomycetales bacterium 10988]
MKKKVMDYDLDYPGDDGLEHYQGSPFTGISVHHHNELDSEQEYRDGLLWGKSRTWAYGKLWKEEDFLMGIPHGSQKVWHQNGQLAEQAEVEVGRYVTRRRWDEEGNLVEDYKVEEDPEGLRILQKQWKRLAPYIEHAQEQPPLPEDASGQE